jgi:uncharacterized RDD family membrane protein YckC
MPITVTCPSCNKGLKVPDGAAGKKGRCPQCATVIEIPAASAYAPPTFAAPPQAFAAPPQVYDPEPVDDAAPNFGGINTGFGGVNTSFGGIDAGGIESGEGRRKPCPKCGEMILENAKKCRYCNEYFDAALKARSGGVLASPLTRLGAVLLDSLVYLGAAIPLLIGIFAMEDGSQREPPPFAIGMLIVGGIAVLAIAIYQMVLLSTQGQTLGKRWMKVRIVRHEDGGPVGFGKAVAMRAIVPGIIGNIPIVGAFFSLADPLFIFGSEHRCLHDMIAGTKVVCV